MEAMISFSYEAVKPIRKWLEWPLAAPLDLKRGFEAGAEVVDEQNWLRPPG
jgi:hypothetical protein